MSDTIRINVGKGYDFMADSGLIDQVCPQTMYLAPVNRVAILTDSNVGPIYADRIVKAFDEEKIRAYTFTYPAGEQSKNISVVADFLDFMAENHITRNDMVIALGGGVTGDMAGFAASIYMRGIKFMQVPTTLLAAVDSSVGGKTGVDTKFGKNMTGTFWQPSMVLYDTDTFATLSEDAILDGTAEIIKTAAIKKLRLFKKLEEEDLAENLDEIVSSCVNIKGEIVAEDEKDTGIRKMLNFGHTFGHAIELRSGYSISHGRAVAMGMLMVTKATEKHRLTEEGTYERLYKLIASKGFETETDIPLDELCEAARNDKKADGNFIKIIYLKRIGKSAELSIRYDELMSFFS